MRTDNAVKGCATLIYRLYCYKDMRSAIRKPERNYTTPSEVKSEPTTTYESAAQPRQLTKSQKRNRRRRRRQTRCAQELRAYQQRRRAYVNHHCLRKQLRRLIGHLTQMRSHYRQLQTQQSPTQPPHRRGLGKRIKQRP